MTKTPKITYSKKWFNPLFFILEDIVKNEPKIKRVLIYGGKSASKTFSIAQLLAKQGVEKGRSSIMFRKESTRVKTTIKQTFKAGVETTRLNNAWTTLDRQFKCYNGANVILSGLDTEDKAKGVEGYNFVLFDELDQFAESEYNQTNLSLRGEGRKVFFCTWNPVSKNSWVKKKLVDAYEWLPYKKQLPSEDSFVKISSCGTTLLVKTTYKDNYWTVGSPCGTYGYKDENLIADYEKLKETDYNSYRVNVLGEWGNISIGGEFYKDFKVGINVERKKYNPNLPLHISFDENVHPYVSLSVYQAEGFNAWKINEICLETPFNTLVAAVTRFKKIYPNNNQTIFIYGDRTSLKQDSKLEKGQNFFTMVVDYLNGYRTKLRLPNRNPNVALRGNFMNALFRGDIANCSYAISDNCVNTIDDYECLKEAPDGTKHKGKVTHPVTKVRYEEYGHLSDTDDYFICEYFKAQYNKFAKIKVRPQPRAVKR